MTTTRDAKNEKHIKELHAKLKITAAEENLWSAVAQAMRDSVAEIDKAVDKRASMMHGASAVEELSAYADIAQAHADSVKKLSIAFVPLYKAMPDAQKKVADEVFMQRDHGKMMMMRAK
ncbi:Spy/CpxP family protein refolding chaperone [Undibacterium sp. RuRC25W]|uniref:Spy/CpxP family protein refolding chaperone n=1 Tax=Undibacterium sp. RuRC25W TaxID=3413047 RepID=UPI003BF04CDE